MTALGFSESRGMRVICSTGGGALARLLRFAAQQLFSVWKRYYACCALAGVSEKWRVRENCDVERIVEELVKSGSEDEIVVLIYMSRYDAVPLSAVCLALGGGRYYAASRVAKAVLRSLIEKGLVRQLDIKYRRKIITVYTLTDCGLRVARALAKIFEVQQP